MIEKIKEILKTVDNDGWLIQDTKTESNELFFIKNKLDMNRGKKVDHISVTIYRDTVMGDTKLKGSSTTSISPTMNEEEIKEALDVASLAASFVKNEYYDLVAPTDEQPLELKTNFTSDISSYMPQLVDAVYNEDKYENGRINSSEFFINKHTIRRVNSKGIDIEYTKYDCTIELVVEWKEQSEEVELYKMLQFSDFNLEKVSKSVKDMLKEAKERALAEPLTNIDKVPVILTKDAVKQILSYYVLRSNARFKYEGYFDTEVGMNLQGDNVKGDQINITLNPVLENSTMSAPYDSDGFLLKELELIKDGVIKNMVASKRYADYLNVTPTGNIPNIIVESGSALESEMKSKPYLELLEFSDFQANPLTGDFGGEIRLGRYYDGEKVTAISGGSVTGNIKNIQEDLKLSKELQESNGFVGPKYLMINEYSLTSSK